MSDKRSSRREREKLEHRRQMLAVALDLFAARGYHNVSMHEIAEKAEFAIGTLYKFFKNKEDLYGSLMLEASGKFHDVLLAALGEGDDEYARILNYVHGKGEVFMNSAKAVRLYFAGAKGASINPKAGLEPEMRAPYEEIVRELAAVFRSGIKKGLFHKLDPYYLAVALDTFTNAALFLWLEDPEHHPYQRKLKTMLKIFFGPVKTN
jgi:TetR/AcrR family transcriptional regulator